MTQADKPRSRWRQRVLQLLAGAGWVVFISLLPHQSVSPEYFGRYSPEYMLFLSIILSGVMVLTIPLFVRIRRPAFIGAMNLGGKLALLVLSASISLLAVEFFIRSTDFLGASMFQETTRYVLELEGDDQLVYKQRAGLDTVYQDVAFRTNALGLRDDPIVPLADNGLRILVLGDSVTLGWGVAVEDTYTEQLEQLLSDELERPVQVINSGVSGYNTEQELIFLRRHIAELAPDLVLLLYVENDVEPKAVNIIDMQRRWKNPPSANATLLRWSWFYRILYYMTPDLLGNAEMPATDLNEGWEQSMADLSEVNRVSQEGRAQFVAYLYRMLADEVTDSLHQDINAVAAGEGFRYIDSLPWFEPTQFRAQVNSFIDTHPNAVGHRILAEGIARDLQASGIICQLTEVDQGEPCSQQGGSDGLEIIVPEE